jgi:hypothetical protein
MGLYSAIAALCLTVLRRQMAYGADASALGNNCWVNAAWQAQTQRRLVTRVFCLVASAHFRTQTQPLFVRDAARLPTHGAGQCLVRWRASAP